MKVTVFSAKKYDRQFLEAANAAAGSPHRLTFRDLALTAVWLISFMHFDLGFFDH